MAGEKKSVRFSCPYCSNNFEQEVNPKEIAFDDEAGISSLLTGHPNSNDCGRFIAFIDHSFKIRGYQKVNNEVTVDKRHELELMLEEKLRFYHLKLPAGTGKLGNFKMPNCSVADRVFTSSDLYNKLINFLDEHKDKNLFGLTAFNYDNAKENIIIYGKHEGVLFTLLFKDEKILGSSLNEIKEQAVTIVKKLIELYGLN